MAATASTTPSAAHEESADQMTNDETGLSDWIALSEQIALALDPKVRQGHSRFSVHRSLHTVPYSRHAFFSLT